MKTSARVFVTVAYLLANLVSILCADYQEFQSDENLPLTVHEETSFLPKNYQVLWFTRMPSLPLLLTTNTKSLPDGICKKQLDSYYRSLSNGTLWAVQMFDSSVKNVYGIIDGHTRHLGSFDQCYRIAVNVSGEKGVSEIRGRYCLVDVVYRQKNESKKSTGKLDIDFDYNESVWEAIKEKGDFRRIKRYAIQLALCIPAGCSAKEIETLLEKPISKFGNEIDIDIRLSIDDNNCHTNQEETSISIYGILFCCFLLLLVFIVIISTYYDLKCGNGNLKGNDKKNEFVLCFSARRNFNDIFSVIHNHRGLDSIHTIRTIFMMGIIFGHNSLQYFINSTINGLHFERSFTKPLSLTLHEGTIVTDGFFGISGLLMAYNLLEELDRKKKLNYIKKIIIRYIRFTPVYLIVIFFNALILPHIGVGPMWKKHVVGEFGYNCTKNWWSNLLYINNYVKTDEFCMFQSWYLTINFQFSVVAPLIIYVIWKIPRKFGYSFLALLVILSAIPPFYMSYYYNAAPFLQGFPYYRIMSEVSYFYDYYIKAHMRFTSYLVGLIVGVFIYDYNFAKWRLPKIWSQILIILLGPIMAAYIVIFGFKYYDPNVQTTPLETALYASIHRGAFAFSTCSIIMFITIGDGLGKAVRQTIENSDS